MHAARCLDHPEPEQLLRRHHPLSRWADADHLPNWHWRNANEPDRTIHAALHAGEIPRLRIKHDQIH